MTSNAFTLTPRRLSVTVPAIGWCFQIRKLAAEIMSETFVIFSRAGKKEKIIYNLGESLMIF